MTSLHRVVTRMYFGVYVCSAPPTILSLFHIIFVCVCDNIEG
jgi:hypothetical protein